MASVTRNNTDRVLQLAHELGILRSRDLARYGIAREYLARLVRAGMLERVGRGLYVLPDAELTAACERTIRNYDPCISCSAHFLTLEVERR